MSKLTAAYGVAQIGAPAITGLLAGQQGSYAAGFYLASGVMVVGTLLFGVLWLVERAGGAAPAGTPRTA